MGKKSFFQLIVEGVGGDPNTLTDISHIHLLLDLYWRKLGESEAWIIPPLVFYRNGDREKQKRGISGFLVTEKRQMYMFTYPEKGYLNINVIQYEFPEELSGDPINELVRKLFVFQRIETKLIRLVLPG